MRWELLDLCSWIDWRLRIENRIVVSLKVFAEEGQYVCLCDLEVVEVVPLVYRH